MPPDHKAVENSEENGHSKSKAIELATANLPKFNTPMYDGLESNLPHMLMQFSDAPFPEGTQLFAERETVMQYLEKYASSIVSLIQFNHQVLDVRPTQKGGSHIWEVSVRDSAAGEHIVECFDAVVAANGHCNWPLLPSIEGIDAWSAMYPDSLHHSVSYKNPKAFMNKRVLLVGGGPSGADIERQIGSVCQHPLLVARIAKSPYHTEELFTRDYPALVGLMPNERAARFEDGSIERDIDAIVLCTGYAYCFPFLASTNPGIKDEGVGALPLYQHIFHMDHSTLAFIEIPEMIVPFPLAESQAAVVARVWSGRLSLPTSNEMQHWQETIVRERGVGRKTHGLTPPSDLEYMNEMFYWSCQAKELANGNSGKMPKRWNPRSCWLRMGAAEMKKAFNARGEERHQVLTYEELGFSDDKEGLNGKSK